MERGDYDRRLQRKRTRPTDEDVQELIALISKDERTAKVSVIKPIFGRPKIFASLTAMCGSSVRMLRHGIGR
jgi:hypothetical protein